MLNGKNSSEINTIIKNKLPTIYEYLIKTKEQFLNNQNSILPKKIKEEDKKDDDLSLLPNEVTILRRENGNTLEERNESLKTQLLSIFDRIISYMKNLPYELSEEEEKEEEEEEDDDYNEEEED